MKPGQSALERAFELAGSGTCTCVEDIRRQLAREGFDQNQIAGPRLTRQLLDIARRARPVIKEVI
jgi:uncharacterized protein (DUF2461 family)